jgi:fibronectin-binding autotransporter adhesin
MFAAAAGFSAIAQADIFDTNGTASLFGVTNGSTYDWWAANTWSNTTTVNDGTASVITWEGTASVSEQAFFAGSGSTQNYTVRLGSGGSTDTYIQNLALNVNAGGSAAMASTAGNVTIGNTGDTGRLILRVANSVGAQSNGTLTINNGVNLNAFTMNFRGGNVVINGIVSGAGASNIASGGGFGLTGGTLTLAGDNTFAGNTSAASGYVLNLQHANALGATGGTNTVTSGGSLQISSGVSIGSGESVTINGAGVSNVGALRAGSGGGSWAGQVTLGDASARIGALAGQTFTITGSIVSGVGSIVNISGESGTGVVVLNPTTSNTYSGTTNVIRGILRLGKTDALPTGTTLDVDSANLVTDAANFDLAGFSQTVAVLQDSATSNINGRITNSLASSNSTLTVNQASNTTFDSVIENGSGTVVLTKGGVGNLTLTGANTFTGGTLLKNGTITLIGGNDRLATGGSLALGDVGTSGKLVLGDGTTARNQALAGLTATGLGGSVVGAHATTNAVLTLAIASGSNTFAGTLGGAGTNENKLTLTKTGAGILSLTGPNTYSGPTTLTLGTTQIGVASVGSVGAITSSAIGTGTLTFNGGALSSDGTTARTILNPVTFSGNATLGDASNNGKLTFSAGLDLGASARTITVNSDVQLDGSFTNSAAATALIKSGAGTLTINAANTSFGTGNGFTIGAGTVVAANAAAMGNAGQIVTLSSGSGFGTLDLATDTTANAYVLNFGSVAGAGGTVIVNRASNGAAITHTMGVATFGNAKINVLAGSKVTSGVPTLEFAGITLSAGAGGDGATTFNPTTANMLISGAITRTGGSANSLVLDGTSTGNLISGTIAGPQTLTKSNSSTWELSNANAFSGTTKVNGGTLKLTNNLALQSSAFDTSGAGTLDITTINTPTFGGLTSATSYVLPSNVTSLTLNPSASVTQTYTGDLSRTGGGTGLTLTKTGAGTQILSGTNSYTGLTTVNGGELRVTTAAAIGGTNVTVTSGQLALNGNITVSGKSLTTSGSGSNFFGGLQSVTGTNTWDGSVLLGADLSRMGARKDATLVLSGAIDDGASTFTVVIRNENQNNTSGGGNATTITELSGVSSYGGNTQLIAGVTRLAGGDNRLPTGTVLQFGGSGANAKFDMNGRNQEVAGLAVMSTNIDTQRDWNSNELTNSSGTASTLTVNTTTNQTFGITPTNFGGRESYVGIISGKIALVKSGSAGLTLSGTNTYTDGTTINEGTLTLGHATNTLQNDGAVNINGGTLALGVNADTVGAVTLTSGSITGTGTLTGTGSNFDVRSGTISAKLGGIVGLDKTTGGTVTISSDNSSGGYSGNTTVSAGTLLVNGNISTSALTTVSGTGTLGGSGEVGNTLISTGGTFSPGNSIDSLGIVGDLTLESGSFSLFEIMTNNLSDFATVSGLLTFGGTLNVNNIGGALVSGDTFDLFNWTNSSGSFSSVNLPSLDPGLTWDHSALYTSGTITVIPEPSAALLGGLGLLALLRRRRA